MKLGIVLPLIEVADITRLAVAVEDRGFESLFIGEHTHMPTSTVHAYTKGKPAEGRSDGFVPDYYRRFPDPYIVLAAAAASTSAIRLGTAIALPAEHNPLEMAKEIATLDQISGGRFVFGAGYGWNRPEVENNGVAFDQRHEVFREKVMAMQALWRDDVAAFEGTHVRFTESWSYPKPVQRPGPPVLIGAKLLPRTIRHIVEFADGCIPVNAFEGNRLADDVTALRRAVADAGRDPGALDITVVEPSGGFAGKKGREAFDANFPTAAFRASLRDAGVTRLVLSLPLTDPELTAYALERYAPLVDMEA